MSLPLLLLVPQLLLSLPAPADDAPATETPSPQASPSEELTAEDLLRKAEDYMGGRERLDKVESVYFEAVNSMKPPLLVTFARKGTDKLFSKTVLEGSAEPMGMMGSDGASCWVFQPTVGGYRTCDKDTFKTFAKDANILGLVTELRHHYGSFGKPEQTTYEERKAFKVKMKGKSNSTAYSVFDEESGRVLAIIYTQTLRNTVIETHLIFNDWQEVEGTGIRFFREMVSKSQQFTSAVKITTLKINDVDESLFALPPQVKQLIENPDSATPMPLPEGIRPAATPPARPAPSTGPGH